jgi:hypothetical protein
MRPFDELVAKAVDSAFLTLGSSARDAIYFHLNDRFEIAKDEIPSRLVDFDQALERIFGNGARFLEILIMKKLYEQIGKPLRWNENEDLVFLKYLATAKQSYSTANR